jgi:hypothetical protein
MPGYRELECDCTIDFERKHSRPYIDNLVSAVLHSFSHDTDSILLGGSAG